MHNVMHYVMHNLMQYVMHLHDDEARPLQLAHLGEDHRLQILVVRVLQVAYIGLSEPCRPHPEW